MLLGGLLLASSSSALERASIPVVDRADEWNVGQTCLVRYYNICTGWAWQWSGFGDGDRIGTVFDVCGDEEGGLLQTSVWVISGAEPGYGFTGTIAVHHVDSNLCPIGAPLAAQPFLPSIDSFQVNTWGGLPVAPRFAVILTLEANEGIPNPSSYGTDRPAAGPTGPQACGTCYPENRVTRSFQYGTTAAPICPGSAFTDGVCNAELFWDAWVFPKEPPFAVEAKSWGSIKGLYR